MASNPNKTVYKSYPATGKGTINTGTTLNVNFGILQVGTSVVVTNFDGSNTFEVQLNSNTNDKITVPTSQSLVFNGEYITNVYLSNASGSAIEYQVLILGA